MEALRIGALTETPCTCRPTEPVGELRERLVGAAWELCAVLGEREVVLGVLHPGNLDGDGARPAQQVMDPAPSTFRPNVPVEELQRWFARHEQMRAAPVTTPEGRLLGVVTRSRLEAAIPVASRAG